MAFLLGVPKRERTNWNAFSLNSVFCLISRANDRKDYSLTPAVVTAADAVNWAFSVLVNETAFLEVLLELEGFAGNLL